MLLCAVSVKSHLELQMRLQVQIHSLANEIMENNLPNSEVGQINN